MIRPPTAASPGSRSRRVRLLALPALLAAALLGRPGAADAQCIGVDCDDSTPPTLSVTPGSKTYGGRTADTVPVLIVATDNTSLNVTATYNGTAPRITWTKLSGSGEVRWNGSFQAVLRPGANVLSVSACDQYQNCTPRTVTYTWDTTLDEDPPAIGFSPDPATDPSTRDSLLAVRIAWSDDQALNYASISIQLNGAADAGWTLTQSSAWSGASSKTVVLRSGSNTLVATIRDNTGKQTSRTAVFHRDRAGPRITLTPLNPAPAPDASRSYSVSVTDSTGLDAAAYQIALNGRVVSTTHSDTHLVPGDPTSVVVRYSSGGTLSLPLGENVLEVRACDRLKNCATAASTLVRSSGLAKQKPVLTPAHHPDFRDVSAFGVTLGHATPAYISLDAAHAAALFYASGQARPTGLVLVDAADHSSTPPEKMSISLRTAAGAAVTLAGGVQEVFYRAGPGVTRLTAQFDAGSLATGAHAYTAVVRSWFPGDAVPAEATVPVRVLVVNEKDSPFGWGWSLAGVRRLHVQSDGVLLTGGDGSAAFFRASCTTETGVQVCEYLPPAGDFSGIVKSGTSYRRTLPGGVVETYGATGLLGTVRDRFGNQASYGYDAAGRLTTITDPAGKSITLGYNAAGRLATLTDPGGRQTRVTITTTAGADFGNLRAVHDPDGVAALQVAYGADHLAQYWTDRAGARTDAGYHPLYLTTDSILEPQRLADGVQARPKTLVRSLQEASMPPTTATGTAAAPAPRVRPDEVWVKVVDAKGDSSTYVPDRFGAPLRVRDEKGRVAWALRDAHGRDTLSVSAEGDTLRHVWSGMNLTRVFRFARSWDAARQAFVVDTVDELVREYDPRFGLVTHERGNVTPRWFWYGALGQVDSALVAGQKVARFTYDARGRVLTATDPMGHVSRTTYEAGGFQNTATAQDETGSSSFTYDAFGRLVSTRRMPVNLVTTVSYDTLNRVLATTDPLSRTTRAAYATAGGAFQSAVTDPLQQVYRFYPNPVGADTLQTAPDGVQRRMGYDARGQVRTVRNQRGQTVEIVYDLEGRPTQLLADGRVLATYSYDVEARWMAVKTAESTDTVHTNTFGQVTSLVTVRGGQRYALEYDYVNHLPYQLTFVWPGQAAGAGAMATYRYDGARRLSEIYALGLGWTKLYYNDDGAPRRLELPTATADAVTLSYGAHRLTGVAYSRAALDGRLGVALGRDSLGRVVQRRFSGSDTLRSYTYDRAGQLTGLSEEYAEGTQCPPGSVSPEECTGPGTVVSRTEAYTYDLAGNRTDRGAVLQTGNRLARFDGYTLEHDADGNLTRKVRAGFDQRLYWNALGQLDSVATNGAVVRFGYDGFGRRVRRSSATGTVQYIYDGSEVAVELDGAGEVKASYVSLPGMDQPLAMQTADGRSYFYLRDELGSVVGLLDKSGALVNEYRYGPWGEAEHVREGVPNARRYTAREHDAETGLYFYRARYYDPALGRFVSKDPVGLDGGINPYAYVDNDPVNGVDPTGTCRLDPLFPYIISHFPNRTYIDFRYMDCEDGEDASETWMLQRLADESYTRNECCFNYYKGLSRSELILLGVRDRLRPVKPYLDGMAMGAISILPMGGWGGTALVGGGRAHVFWSGTAARAAANAYAARTGAVTLEMTTLGKGLTQLEKVLGPERMTPLWTAASRAFARSSIGRVQVFHDAAVRVGGTWALTEYPVLASKPAVKLIYNVVF